MEAKMTFKRYELKYVINREQRDALLKAMEGHLALDMFGHSTIRNLYYDTDDWRLVRRSIEKPWYKEKLRLRSYGLADEDSPVYLELKCKAYDTVYKRRVQSTLQGVRQFFESGVPLGDGGQISREINAFCSLYDTLAPSCLIIYDRTAYYEPDGDLRLTIDENPSYRTEDLTLKKSMDGISLLKPGWTILEVKVQEAMPLWLAAILSGGGIRKASFSKYGEAYRQQLVKVQGR